MLTNRILRIGLGLFLAAIALAGVLLWLNLSHLTRRFAEQTVPGLSFADIDIGWNQVKLTEFQFISPAPTEVSVAAQTVDAHPAFLSFLGDEIRVSTLDIGSPSFRLVRRDVTQPAEPGGERQSGTHAVVGRITIRDGKGEIQDYTVAGPPARVELDDIQISISDLKLPPQAGPVYLDAACLVRGDPDGDLSLTGWLDSVNDSADLTLQVNHLDLANIRPYLREQVATIESADGKVDLQLNLSMLNGVYEAEGKAVLSELQVAEHQSGRPDLPRILFEQYLQVRGNRIEVPFRVTGDLNQKQHRLDLATLVSGVLAPQVGVETLQKQFRPPENLEDLRRLKDKARSLRDLLR